MELYVLLPDGYPHTTCDDIANSGDTPTPFTFLRNRLLSLANTKAMMSSTLLHQGRRYP